MNDAALTAGATAVAALLLAGPTVAQAGRAAESAARGAVTITHGPMLGRPAAHGVAVWVRTSRPAPFEVACRAVGEGRRSSGDGEQKPAEAREAIHTTGRSRLAHDNTGWVRVEGLAADTEYAYTVTLPDGDAAAAEGTFRTLPDAASRRHPELNPDGLFDFSFEHGSCNFQFRRNGLGHDPPAYRTMNERLAGRIHFQILNGDFIYETGRGTTVAEWRDANGIATEATPEILRIAPRLAGVWQNYKIYLDRAPALAAFHRRVPALFMFDDHEILNDVNATADVGVRDRRTLFRDVGIRGWRDYLGWANPLPPGTRATHFGRARLTAGEDVLLDEDADFTRRNEDPPTLHVHRNGGHEAAGTYAVEEVLGPHRLRIRPAPAASGDGLAYSIGMRNHFQMRVANCHFFVLDTRAHRERHDIARPAQEGLSMLGAAQKRWLKEGMRASDADFFFVTSTVPFTLPHVAPDLPEKDEAWTVYLDERDELFAFFETLGRPVLLLTGDLHNSAAISISEHVREYVCGPHNSPNHRAVEEGGRPPSGPFTRNGRTVDIHWSSYFREDVPGRHALQPYYVVFQVNNVVDNPGPGGEPRWIAHPRPQVVVRFHDGLTGELVYAESVRAAPQR